MIDNSLARKRAMVSRVIRQSDELVLWFRYRDTKGIETNRAVSPYRLFDSGRFVGLCLVREEPRQFDLSRCEELQIGLASDVLLPFQS